MNSLAYQFRNQLIGLMNNLENTNPCYIKCIKPNHHKSPNEFDPPLVLDQLKNTRIVESLEIVQKGFPYRMKYKAFAERYKVINPNYKGSDAKKAVELILSKLNYDNSRFKRGYKFVHYKSEDNRFLEAFRNVNIDRLVSKVQNAFRKKMAKQLSKDLKKYKKICEAALEDGTLPVVKAALRKGEDLRFIIKEHRELKQLASRLIEEEELKKELADLAKYKTKEDIYEVQDRAGELIGRAGKIGYTSSELQRLKELYEKASEIKQIKDTLLKSINGFVDLDSLREALARARELDEIPDDLIEKANNIFIKFEQEVNKFREIIDAFTSGCPTDVVQASKQVEFEHVEPLIHEFRLMQPFYNKDEFNQHLYEFEIMLNMRKAC